MNKENVISYFFIGLLVFIVYQVIMILSPFLQPFFWATILAFAVYPLYEGLKKRLNGRETLSAVIITVIMFLLVIPFIVMLVANITGQAIELYQFATDYIRNGHLETSIDKLRALSFVQRVEARIVQWEPIKESVSSMLLNSTKAITNFTVAQAGVITKNLFYVCLNIVLIMFLNFILLKDGRKIYDFIYHIAPLEEQNKKDIFKQVSESFAAVIRGQLLTSLTQATVAGITFWFLGLPLAIFFGIATFIGALIPFLGAASIWLPLAIYLFVTEEIVKGVILVVVGVGIISLIDNFMKPALIGEKTKLPFFLLFFGILGGLKIYGLLGVFLAPVVLALFFSLVKIYQERFS